MSLPASLADLLTIYITQQQRMIRSGDVSLRGPETPEQDEPIHDFRVATRRLRSILRIFQDLFDPDQAIALDEELRWYAALLGEVRDVHVMRARLTGLINELDPSLVIGPVRERVDVELSSQQVQRWDHLQRELDGERYQRLLAEVDRWTHEPPWSPTADRPAKAVRNYVQHSSRSVKRRLRRADATGDPHLHHAARKAAKRARYTAETAVPVLGDKASRLVDKFRSLQDVLGEHQDSLLCAELLLRLGMIAGNAPGENGFTFGLLYEREHRRAANLRTKSGRSAHRAAAAQQAAAARHLTSDHAAGSQTR